MTFREIFRFEFMYQLRRPWPWLFFVVLLVLTFMVTRDGSLSEVLYADFFINSPFSIAKNTVVGGLFWLVMAAAIAGDAAARDVSTGMHALTYTAPVRKIDYLGGRFCAALLLNAILLLAVQAGILLGVYLPGVNAELIGPFRPAAFINSFAYIALPNAFVATALQFFLAARSGRAMTAYIGSFLLVFMGFFVASLLLFKRGLGTMLDPIGMRFILEDISHLWTTVEMSWRLIELKDTVLMNRLLWSGIGLLILCITYLTFRFVHRTGGGLFGTLGFTWSRLRGRPSQAMISPTPTRIGVDTSHPIVVPIVPLQFGLTAQVQQAGAIAWSSFRTIARSWAGIALLAGIPLLTIPVLLDQLTSDGVGLLPTTTLVLMQLTGPLSDELSRWVIIPFLIVYFAGELIWREREARLGEITDTMPGSEWTPLIGKFLGLGLVFFFFQVIMTMASMLFQLLLGYQQFEAGLYFKIMFGLQLPEYLLFVLLSLVVHVLVNQKFVGHLVAVIIYVFIVMASMFGVEHNLLIYGAGPTWSYTEMRGFGPTLEPWLWFKLYWGAWALLLAVAAKLLWVRGKENGFRMRLRLARRRFTRQTAWVTLSGIVILLSLGAFIFYNTNILNEYLSESDVKARSAAYEQRYGKYAGVPQPTITSTRLDVDIYPDQRSVEINGTYLLVNRSTTSIDTIHVATVQGIDTREMHFNRAVTYLTTEPEYHHRMYALHHPLAPGDSLRLHFNLLAKAKGFRENGVDPALTKNGTSFTNAWLPKIGYIKSRELMNASDRRPYGLTPRPLIASLYDTTATKERGTGITFEAVVSTRADQVGVAPGQLRNTWTKGDRKYFHYASDGPIGGEWAFFSARYALHEDTWKGADSAGARQVAIRIFHHPKHNKQLERMVRGIKASLDYYTGRFGLYRHNHITVVERPGNGVGMHADPSLLIFSEGFAHWKPDNDPEALDMPFAVIAHEMAHQWTVPYAAVEGAPVMSESLAWYYGMKVVEHASGQAQLQRLRYFMRQPHPHAPIRRGEPLLRGLDPYLSYRRGPFALYALSEYMGEDRVNTALKNLLDNHRPENAPLATTLDLFRELQAVTPDTLNYLLHDLFEVNSYWNLETENATAKHTSSGAWQVTLKVRARKRAYDSAGTESDLPMNEWIPVGIFADAGNGDALSKPLYLQRHRIRSGEQIITVTVHDKPSLAGIDPYHLLDWQESDDENTLPVKFDSSESRKQ